MFGSFLGVQCKKTISAWTQSLIASDSKSIKTEFKVDQTICYHATRTMSIGKFLSPLEKLERVYHSPNFANRRESENHFLKIFGELFEFPGIFEGKFPE